MIQYQLFPRSAYLPNTLKDVISCFERKVDEINSHSKVLKSDEVLSKLCPELQSLGFRVETGKTAESKINVPVLFGKNNNIDKCFNADAISSDGTIVIEIEAGRATENNQFLKDIFQACMMFNVEYLVLAVRNEYRSHYDFDRIYMFLETLYISGRIKLPLEGILLIGY